jgi:hypothetical protein
MHFLSHWLPNSTGLNKEYSFYLSALAHSASVFNVRVKSLKAFHYWFLSQLV